MRQQWLLPLPRSVKRLSTGSIASIVIPLKSLGQQHAEREFCRKNNTETLGSRILCSFCKLDYVICRRVNCPKRATEAER